MPAGLAAIESAKRDGRWAAAYDAIAGQLVAALGQGQAGLGPFRWTWADDAGAPRWDEGAVDARGSGEVPVGLRRADPHTLSILWRDGSRGRDAAEAMKITAEDLKALRIVDRIVPEPAGGAHSDPEATIQAVGDAVEDELKKLSNLSPDELRKQRAERFYAIGRAGLA